MQRPELNFLIEVADFVLNQGLSLKLKLLFDLLYLAEMCDSLAFLFFQMLLQQFNGLFLVSKLFFFLFFDMIASKFPFYVLDLIF